MEILLFKTNIQKSDLIRLILVLNQISGIQKWTVDLDDCDRVMRIVGNSLSLNQVLDKLKAEGYDCLHMPVALYEF